jgi:hypothetical protein
MLFEKLALAKIEQAIRNGEFANLPGRGRPIPLDDYFAAPAEQRAAFAVLRNAGVLPEGAEVLKEIAAVEERVRACADTAAAAELRRQAEWLRLRYNLLVERYRHRSRSR